MEQLIQLLQQEEFYRLLSYLQHQQLPQLQQQPPLQHIQQLELQEFNHQE